jgi:hypothetical protein
MKSSREELVEELSEINRKVDADVDRGLELMGVGEEMEQQETWYSCTGQLNLIEDGEGLPRRRSPRG